MREVCHSEALKLEALVDPQRRSGSRLLVLPIADCERVLTVCTLLHVYLFELGGDSPFACVGLSCSVFICAAGIKQAEVHTH